MSRIHISEHARSRLRERHDQFLLAYTNYDEFVRSCYDLFNQAELTNRHVNDAVFMMNLHDIHGYDAKFSFREFKNVLFVIVDSTVITVLDTDVPRANMGGSREFEPVIDERGTVASTKE